ncbi:hypothetical protein ACKWTF_010228 [Chironomus riparius]
MTKQDCLVIMKKITKLNTKEDLSKNKLFNCGRLTQFTSCFQKKSPNFALFRNNFLLFLMKKIEFHVFLFLVSSKAFHFIEDKNNKVEKSHSPKCRLFEMFLAFFLCTLVKLGSITMTAELTC